jgi:hypothetical protein
MAMPRKNRRNTEQKQISKIDRRLNKFIRLNTPEKKYRTTLFDAVFPIASSIKIDAFAIAQGITNTTRIGMEINVCRIDVDAQILSTGLLTNTIRFILVLDTANRNAVSPFADVDLFTFIATSGQLAVSPYIRQVVGKGKRFHILHDEWREVTPTGLTGPGQTQHFSIHRNLSHKVAYTSVAGTNAALSNYSLFVCWYTVEPCYMTATVQTSFNDE